MDFIIDAVAAFFAWMGLDTRFTGALPVAFMKPLSGSGARGLMIDAMTIHGADSFIGRLACTMQGTTDTTFYIVAVYFGSVGIKNTRHAIGCGLLADLAGFVTAIFVAYLFFG
jgi:spore maturation protein SpmB